MKSDEELFLEAYDVSAPGILRHIYFRVNDAGLAEDLTSEVFLKTWQYVREGKEVRNLKAFLYQVANNLIIDHYRSKSKIPLSLEDVLEPADPKEGEKDENIDRQMEMELVKKHLLTLPPDYQQIIVYRYIDDLSIGEIRKLTNKSPANIYVIIHRALKILKKKLENND